jgi:RNA polymerase sigma-70 factor (ECF subfamily)
MAGAVDVASPTRQVRLVRFRPQVQRHILAMVRNAAEAEELTQDTYARALEKVDQLRDPQAALAWLYRIATTVTLDRLRQRRPTTITLDTVAPAAEEVERAADRERTPSLLESALESSEMSDCVQGYLAALPDDYRIAILLRDAHGLSNAEIAELVGCSLATAKIRVHRARTAPRDPRSGLQLRDRQARRARLRTADHACWRTGRRIDIPPGAAAGCEKFTQRTTLARRATAQVDVGGLQSLPKFYGARDPIDWLP